MVFPGKRNLLAKTPVNTVQMGIADSLLFLSYYKLITKNLKKLCYLATSNDMNNLNTVRIKSFKYVTSIQNTISISSKIQQTLANISISRRISAACIFFLFHFPCFEKQIH